MALAPPFYSDLHRAAEVLARFAIETSVNQSTRDRQRNELEHWKRFCTDTGNIYTCEGVKPGPHIKALLIYAGTMRTRSLPHQDQSAYLCRASTISGNISAAGKALENLVGTNPFLTSDGKWPRQLQQCFDGFARTDPPPGRQCVGYTSKNQFI